MNLDRRDIDKDIKERVSSKEKIEELKQKPIKLINGFMEESGLSYFEVFIESELADIMDEVEADNIRLVRVRAGTKRAIDNDYYHKRLSQKEILSHDGNFGVCIGYNHLRGKSLTCVDIDGIKIKKGKVRIKLCNLKIRTILQRYLDSFSTALPERYIVEDYYITQNNAEVVIIDIPTNS